MKSFIKIMFPPKGVFQSMNEIKPSRNFYSEPHVPTVKFTTLVKFIYLYMKTLYKLNLADSRLRRLLFSNNGTVLFLRCKMYLCKI